MVSVVQNSMLSLKIPSESDLSFKFVYFEKSAMGTITNNIYMDKADK